MLEHPLWPIVYGCLGALALGLIAGAVAWWLDKHNGGGS